MVLGWSLELENLLMAQDPLINIPPLSLVTMATTLMWSLGNHLPLETLPDMTLSIRATDLRDKHHCAAGYGERIR